jgi:MraZ protein
MSSDLVYFLGTFDFAMDERGRVPLPPRYRDAFRTGIVLSQGSPDRCLRIYTQEAFEIQAAQTIAQPALRRSGRDMRKTLFSRSYEAELDKQNRILVPAHMREYASLSGKVLVVGNGEWLELWNPDAYAAEMERVDANYAETIETVPAGDDK